MHKLAKKIIKEGSSIVLKTYGKVFYDNAEQEIPFLTIQPDASAKTSRQDFFFEVLITHAVYTTKRNFYKIGEYKSVEINLKNYSFTTVENLRNDIFSNSDFNETIFWEKELLKEKSSDNSFIYFLLFIIGLVTFGLVSNSKRRRKR